MKAKIKRKKTSKKTVQTKPRQYNTIEILAILIATAISVGIGLIMFLSGFIFGKLF